MKDKTAGLPYRVGSLLWGKHLKIHLQFLKYFVANHKEM